MNKYFKYFLITCAAIILLRAGLLGILISVRILLMLMLAAYFGKLIKKYLPQIFSDIYIGKRPGKTQKYDLNSCSTCGWIICRCDEIKLK